MHNYIAALALAGGASARVLPRGQGNGCCFQLKASGEQSGLVGQLGDGQNRIGGGYEPATYCIKDGAITDSNDRGCILTPPTSQFQCDEGATPTEGFSISGEGSVQFNGSNKFYACGADTDQYNIYTKPVEGQKDCVEVTLSSSDGKCSGDGGGGGKASGSSATAQSAASTKPAGEQSSAPTQPAGGKSTAPAEYGSQKPSSSAAPSKPAEYSKQSSAPASSVAPSKPAVGQSSAPTQPAGGKSTAPAEYGSQKPSSSAPKSKKPSVPAETQPAVDTKQPKPETSQPAVQTSQASQPKPETEQPPAYTSQASQPKPVTSMKSVKTEQPMPETSAKSVVTETSIKSVKTSAPAETEKPKTSAAPSAPQGTAPAGEASSTPQGTAPAYKSSSVPQGTAPAGKPSSAGPDTASSTKPSGTSSGSACQTSLSGAYQTPHLIIPISSEQPDEAFGTSYNGQINSTTNTIFNFDIPQDYEGKQCSIIFLFPKKEDLETSNYEFGGKGSLGCSELSDSASEKTSYSNAPKTEKDLGTVDLQPGNSYVVATQDCKAGQTQSIELSSENDLSLNFFEDWNPSPLGLYITSC